jgi:hypothetical protein
MNTKLRLALLMLLYFAVTFPAASMRLDEDEFTFVRNPYELLGGDYTRGYLQEGDFSGAASVAARSYYFYWKYRPLFAPLIDPADKRLFEKEESKFGYKRPPDLPVGEQGSEERYQSRLIVPEPDRFYRHGAGKPLLASILNIPALAIVAAASGGDGGALLKAQFSRSYSPIFIGVRLTAILCGALSLVFVYLLARRVWGDPQATFAGAFFILFPSVPLFFPNIHHDAYMVPFLLGTIVALTRQRFVIAGLSFGLALAAKNTALMLLPALLIWVAIRKFADNKNSLDAKAVVIDGAYFRKLLLFGLVAFITLLPFAHPVSYASEVLTPITEREFDPRGEDVGEFTLRAVTRNSGPAQPNSSHRSSGETRPEVKLIQRLVPWSVHLGFVLIAILACATRLANPIYGVCLLMALMTFPHSLVFGDGLIWRSIAFAPFFAILAAEWSDSKMRWWVLGLMATITIILVADPLTARGIAAPDSAQRWWSMLG